MKLIYCTSITLPKNKQANKIQIFAMVGQLSSKLGKDFYLGVKNINKDINMQYVELHTAKSYFLAFKYLRFIIEKKINYIYCREPRLLLGIILLNKVLFHLKFTVIYEVHTLDESGLLSKLIEKQLSRSADYIIFITENLQRVYCRKFQRDLGKTIVSPDGVDLSVFNIPVSQEEAKKKLGLPADKKIVLYTGHLYKWKGVDTLIKASPLLNREASVYIVGGTQEDIAAYQKEFSDFNKVIFAGHKSHQEIPFWLKAADVLVLPNSGQEKISSLYTSPLKMFEYMASQRPIVASDLPSLREILNEKNCLFCQPDDPESLASNLKKVLADKELAGQISKQAFEDVNNYTWEKRVGRILDFIQ